MAPVSPLGRAGAIKLVRGGHLPLRFGSPHPTVMVLLEDGVYRIRGLAVDEGEAHASSERAMARGESWMPEHYDALAKPTGPIHAEAPSVEELITAMKTMPWPDDW
jgi:hypothetical protein